MVSADPPHLSVRFTAIDGWGNACDRLAIDNRSRCKGLMHTLPGNKVVTDGGTCVSQRDVTLLADWDIPYDSTDIIFAVGNKCKQCSALAGYQETRCEENDRATQLAARYRTHGMAGAANISLGRIMRDKRFSNEVCQFGLLRNRIWAR